MTWPVTQPADCPRRRAPARGEQGLTLIELLLSLAILAVLTGFLAGGLSMARRAFDADRASEIGSETSAAIQTVSALIGSALPVRADRADPKATASGSTAVRRRLSFVGLSEGRSLRGGPHKIRAAAKRRRSRRRCGRLRRGKREGHAGTSRRRGSWCSAASAKFASAISAASNPARPTGLAGAIGSRAERSAGSGFDPDRISRTSDVMNPPRSWRFVRDR